MQKQSIPHIGRARMRVRRDHTDLSAVRAGIGRVAWSSLAMLALAFLLGRRLVTVLPRRRRITTAPAGKLSRPADNALIAVLAFGWSKTSSRAHHLSWSADCSLIATLTLRGRIAGATAHVLARTADNTVIAVLA